MELSIQILGIILNAIIIFLFIDSKRKDKPMNSAKKEVESILHEDKLPQDLEDFLKQITGSDNAKIWEVKVPINIKKKPRNLQETIAFHNEKKLQAIQSQDFEEAQRIKNIISQLQKKSE